MKNSIDAIKQRLYDLGLRIDKETYNPSGSRSEVKKLLKQKTKLEKQLEKALNKNFYEREN